MKIYNILTYLTIIVYYNSSKYIIITNTITIIVLT